MYRLVIGLTLVAAVGAAAQPPLVPFEVLPVEEDAIPFGPPLIVQRGDLPPPGVVEERQPACTDVVLRWNEAALQAIRAEKTNPPVAARNLAVAHVAMYDAMAGVRGTYQPFFTSRPAAGACGTAAMAVAAHRTLVALFPNQAERFDAALDASLAGLTDAAKTERGVAHGLAVAEDVLRWRGNDLAAGRGTVALRVGPGYWTPTPPAYKEPLLPGWAGVKCFAIPSGGAFRPPGPPAVTDEAFRASYHEVKLLGGTASPVRTADQTEIAKFWADGEGTVTPPGHWNRIAQAVSAARGSSSAENARLFAALNVALADAAIACWECKFKFAVWRPVTAIREAGRLNDPALAADPTWTPLLPTPPFPAYTSGHSTFSAAGAEVLAGFFGDRVRFATTSDGLPGVTRSFAGFRAAAEEAGVSRIYGGIHWDFDNRDGLACGRKVGEYVLRHHFRPAR